MHRDTTVALLLLMLVTRGHGRDDNLFVAKPFTEKNSFTEGIEGKRGEE